MPSTDLELGTDLEKGARNLLEGCAGLTKGDRLLVLYEAADLGYFDREIVEAVRECARAIGIITELAEVPFTSEVTDPAPELMAKMAAADRTLFLARMGDQIRFRTSMKNVRPIVSYALDGGMLGSNFGWASYQGYVKLKNVVNRAIRNARDIRVTCPLGTDFFGAGSGEGGDTGDVTVARFPMSVFTPVAAKGFIGTIAQKGFLVGTGSQYYSPYSCVLEGVLQINFDGHCITGFEGSKTDVAAAEAHYDQVAKRFDIDRTFVHSWHAGIHPGCAFSRPASESFERWSGGAFGNPRLLHFHTCGTYAPGEISLNVLDPTISIDGVKVWENGRLYPERINGGQAILDQYVCMRAAFDNPAQECGLGPDGQLSFA